MTEEIKKGAILSNDRNHRFILTRTWDEEKPRAVFIGLNPSTADENEDDPTIRRCVGFARRWDCGGLIMVNLFSMRATDPKIMKGAEVPNLESNDAWIVKAAIDAGVVVAAWGNHGKHRNRDKEMVELLRARGIGAFCFGITKAGQPVHPLYQKSDAALVPFG